MTRVYKSTPAGSSGAPPGPRPPGMAPQRPGIQVVARREPRQGKSAAELDGVQLPPPLGLGAGAQTRQRVVIDEDDSVLSNDRTDGHDSRLSNGAGDQPSNLPATFDDDRCAGCGGEGAILVTVGRVVLCDACVMAAVDAVRAEMPRRRLRLAMERLAAGTVSIETVEAIERMVPQQTDNKT